MSAFHAQPMIRLAACLVLALVVSSVHSQQARVADLAVSATLTPGGILAPGTRTRLVLTFHNHGPDDAVSISASSSAFPILSHSLFRLEPSLPSPCSMFFDHFRAPPGSGRPSMLVAAITAGPLAAGATRSCTLDLVVAPLAAGNYELSFRVGDGQVLIIDDNPSNDRVVLPLSFVPQPRPIPSDGWRSSFALVAALTVIGALALRPRRFRARRVSPDGGGRWRA